MAKRKNNVQVVQGENQEPVPTKIIAQSIKKISEGVEAMDRAGLSERAIKVLLKDASGQSNIAVQDVLWGLRNLKHFYLK